MEKTITANAVFVVWQVKVLQNNKALLSTALPDGMYYECTYNGDKDEMYVDCYKKWENFCVSLVRYDNKLTVDSDNKPPAKFPIDTRVEITDETQIFPSLGYLRGHGLFPLYGRPFLERINSDYNTVSWENILTMRATVCDVEYDNFDKQYVYIIYADGNKFFAVAENGLARLDEEKPQ